VIVKGNEDQDMGEDLHFKKTPLNTIFGKVTESAQTVSGIFPVTSIF